MSTPIRFTDGAAYERYMGAWSQLAGRAFLSWLSPAGGGRWLDVGCGNGAFTELLIECVSPSSVDGVDPSEAQIAFARSRPAGKIATFQAGNAMALPFGDDAFDAAVMPLVIAFVPDPLKGVTEMARVVRAGGIVSAYMWDSASSGFPYHSLMTEMRAMGVAIPQPPSPHASNTDALRALWAEAGLDAIETREIHIERTFASFAEYWEIIRGGPSVGPPLAAMAPDALAQLEARMRNILPTKADGTITYAAAAQAVKGAAR